MHDLTSYLTLPPYGLDRAERERQMLAVLSQLTAHHRANCEAYRRLLEVMGWAHPDYSRLEDVPFIPVRLFKELELRSVETQNVVKTMTSSGTSGQAVSRIFLDSATAANQTRVLAKIVSSFIGPKRLPLLVIDSRATVRDRTLFSARGAGILGFSMFGREVEYALDDRMDLDLGKVSSFLERHEGQDILLFGFTFIVWQHFVTPLLSRGVKLPLDRGCLIHGGGWKKLAELAIDNAHFKERLREVAGLKRSINYYGMVEQTGSVFMECEHGNLHSSVFSDILIRSHEDLSVLPDGEVGLVQLLSVLPGSYPGHSILTEDLGRVKGHDDCPCGRKGRYFEILGRVKSAEVRGCSDTYAAPV